MRFRGVAVPGLVLIAGITGCHYNATSQSPTLGPVVSGSTPLEPTGTRTTASGSVTASAVPQPCPPQAGYRVEITVGDVTCSDAYATAAKYDLQGEKAQRIDAFTCYTGTAQTRPLVFSCVSDKAEFSVFEE